MKDQNQFQIQYHFRNHKFLYSIGMVFLIAPLLITANNHVSKWILAISLVISLVSIITTYKEIRKTRIIGIFKCEIKYDMTSIGPQMIEGIYLYETYIDIRKKERRLFDEGFRFHTKDKLEMSTLKGKLIQFAKDQNIQIEIKS